MIARLAFWLARRAERDAAILEFEAMGALMDSDVGLCEQLKIEAAEKVHRARFWFAIAHRLRGRRAR